jgi:hypothetical protein
VHREILKQARKLHPRFFIIDGDLIKSDYHQSGKPEALLADYRSVFATPQNDLREWPQAPGPVIFPVPGGFDEQYFVRSDMATMADTSLGRRSIFEGTCDLGMQLYDVFNLDQMRIPVQPLPEIGKPLPMSDFGDYFIISGAGPRRDCALLVLYRTDRWGFREEQVNWVDKTLDGFRRVSPTLPLIAVASDWTWYFPDSLDDGRSDGRAHAVREGSAQSDERQKARLFHLLDKYHADVAIAAGHHAYWADAAGGLLRVNCGSAICEDPHGERVGVDNLWLEYRQTTDSLFLKVHDIEPPAGCGLRTESAIYGSEFVKHRAAGSVWRTTNP